MTRKTGTLILGMNGGLLVALVALHFLLPPPPPWEAPAVTARIGAVVGQVEIRAGGRNRWDGAKVGGVLMKGDEIRTGLFSEVILQVRGESSVVVEANTSFVIGEEVPERSSFELGEGQITADIPHSSSREYWFNTRGSDAVASAQQGEFSLSSDGKGTVVVDSFAGGVKVKAKGEEVWVNKGKRSVVLPEKSPTPVMPIPTSVALQVKWPPTKTDQTKTQLFGKTVAGAWVLVNGILVRADYLGNFSVEVPLREGINRLVVNVSDPAGNSLTKESPEIQVDTRPPELKVDSKDLWK